MKPTNRLRHWVAKLALRIAVRADPNSVRHAMAGVFMEQMRDEGIVGIEFGYNEDGAPAMLVRRYSELPIVTKH